jgi:hypothetical protein
MNHIDSNFIFTIIIHLLLALVALFWTRNFNQNDMTLSENVLGIFAMYQIVIVSDQLFSILLL